MLNPYNKRCPFMLPHSPTQKHLPARVTAHRADVSPKRPRIGGRQVWRSQRAMFSKFRFQRANARCARRTVEVLLVLTAFLVLTHTQGGEASLTGGEKDADSRGGTKSGTAPAGLSPPSQEVLS